MVGRSRYGFLLLMLVGVVAIMAWPGRAVAQTTTGASLTMSTYQPVVRNKPRVSQANDPIFANTITRADCKDPKLTYTFSLAITGYTSGMLLQAWAGPGATTDCAAQLASSGVVQTCWEVGPVGINTTGATPTAQVTFSPTELFGFGKSGSPFLKTCDDQNDFFRTLQSFNLQFVLLSGQTDVAAKVNQPIYYALEGPAPPASVTAKTADAALSLKWSDIGIVTGDVSYQFYCAPNEGTNVDYDCSSSILNAAVAATSSAGGTSGTGSTGAGGATGDGGTGGTGGASSENGGVAGDLSSAGTAGDLGLGAAGSGGDAVIAAAGSGGEAVIAAADSATAGNAGTAGETSNPVFNLDSLPKCGSVTGKLNLSGYTTQTLTNDVSYAVSVAVVDRYGNVGALSAPTCATPRAVDTFFDSYRMAGGKAGGGFCNIDLGRRGATLPTACLSMLLFGLIWRRKRKLQRDRRSNRPLQ